MPIPTAHDHKLAEIEALAAGVTVQTLRFSPAGDVRQVRARLQAYADAVMEAAHDLVRIE